MPGVGEGEVVAAVEVQEELSRSGAVQRKLHADVDGLKADILALKDVNTKTMVMLEKIMEKMERKSYGRKAAGLF